MDSSDQSAGGIDPSLAPVGFAYPTLRARVRDRDRIIRHAIEAEMELLDDVVKCMALSMLADARFRELAELRALDY